MSEEKSLPNLVIATDNFLPRRDGIVRFLTEILPRLKLEFNITIICPDYGKDNMDITGISFVRIPQTKFHVADINVPLTSPFKIFRALRSADLVFTQTIGPIGGSSIFMASLLRKKIVSFIHSIEWDLASKALSGFFKRYANPFTKRLARFLYARCTQLLVPAESIGNILTWENIKTPKTVVHLGVDTNRFKPLEDEQAREDRRKQLGFSKEHIVIGYHGRISREKDVQTLVRAFVKLRRKYKNLRLLVIGNGIPFLIKQIKKNPAVVYLPAVSNVEYYLPLMDIYCLPSLTETTSLSTLEAMSCQLPVITTRVGFLPDYIIPGKNGLFFDKGNSFSLMSSLKFLLDHSEARHSLGECARTTVRERFDWGETTDHLIAIIKNQ